jgi:outer membrane protein TolC
MRYNHLGGGVACALVALATAGAQPPRPAALDSLIAWALAGGPAVHVARARADAAAARVAPAAARPDPMLMAGVQNLPLSAPGFRDEMTMAMVGVGQTVPTAGKPALRRRAAEAEAEAARADLARTRLEVARDVRVAYYDLAYLDRALALVERSRAVLVELIRLAEARHATGGGVPPAPRPGGTAGIVGVRAGGTAPAAAGVPTMGGMPGMREETATPAAARPVAPMAPGADAMGGAMGGAMRTPIAGGAFQEILRARIEAARLGEDASALTEERRAVLARLNAVLGRVSDASVDAPAVPERVARAAVADSAHGVRFVSAALGARAAGSPLPGVDALQRLAAERSPALRAHEALVAAQAARAELASRARVPDVDVAVQYGVRPRHPDMITATVSLPLPVQRRRVQDQGAAEARAELAALSGEHHRQVAQLGAEIARLHAEAERARTQLALLKGAALPQAHAALAAGAATLAAGQGTLGALLDARAALFNQEAAYWRGLSDFAKAVAELELAVGAEVLP